VEDPVPVSLKIRAQRTVLFGEDAALAGGRPRGARMQRDVLDALGLLLMLMLDRSELRES